ncbi:peptidoglycan-recognition protein LC-like isoform X2 [Danaus plexippus]|uniref:peptidoglycan-recognition protein LC-like isoform X2 n=1 Tax=Danaus plexippus TaxID=13037 RepID=UPI002AB327DE|nr:peptidoglycan-recognition protein LC-like isoform X2 [Danaus plexippus]
MCESYNNDIKMATKASKSNTNGMTIIGNIDDMQIIKEISDEDSINRPKKSCSLNTPLNLPSNLVPNTGAPVYESVSVTNSENVQFGNNTYFNGPVIIKQIVQPKSGVDNVSYTKTEETEKEDSQKPPCATFDETYIKKKEILLWHKITFSAVCITVVGCVVALVLVLQNKSDDQIHTNAQSDYDKEDKHTNSLLIAPNHLRIVSRSDWLSQTVEGEVNMLRQPVPWVIISHTATESCYTQSECVLRVRLIQMYHVEARKWSDIGYNFLVGGDGSVYHGRGWNIEGAHTKGYNKYSIGIAFIGTFNTTPPPKQQVEACEKLLKLGVELGKLAKDYKLFAHRQFMSTLSPGDTVYDIIKEWPHFVNNLTDTQSLIPNY